MVLPNPCSCKRKSACKCAPYFIDFVVKKKKKKNWPTFILAVLAHSDKAENSIGQCILTWTHTCCTEPIRNIRWPKHHAVQIHSQGVLVTSDTLHAFYRTHLFPSFFLLYVLKSYHDSSNRAENCVDPYTLSNWPLAKTIRRPKWPHLTNTSSFWRLTLVLTGIEAQEHTDMKKNTQSGLNAPLPTDGLMALLRWSCHAARPIFTKSTLINISELQTRLNLFSANCNLPSLNWPTVEPTW